ncbi:MAG: transcriptional regulator NrdR [Gemmatimonadota bacterium]|nr:transcriptional regulator NrdR [Gemmatimonadota bacterium]
MRCPRCDHVEDRVVDSRLSRGGRSIRRRRECLDCRTRFTTYEHIEQEPLTVSKTSGAIEPFDRAKLRRSIGIACAKRPISLAVIEELVDGIEERIEALDEREVSSQFIGELVMERLRALDQVAYVRFASVYRNFQDTTEFMEEVRELVDRARYHARGQQDLFGGRAAASEMEGEEGEE